jgi:hypothetical protein
MRQDDFKPLRTQLETYEPIGLAAARITERLQAPGRATAVTNLIGTDKPDDQSDCGAHNEASRKDRNREDGHPEQDDEKQKAPFTHAAPFPHLQRAALAAVFRKSRAAPPCPVNARSKPTSRRE